MRACVETAPLPSASHPPAWAFRVPRPEGDGFRMTARLQGVPKPMLRTVFGKALGLRIWEQARRGCAHSIRVCSQIRSPRALPKTVRSIGLGTPCRPAVMRNPSPSGLGTRKAHAGVWLAVGSAAVSTQAFTTPPSEVAWCRAWLVPSARARKLTASGLGEPRGNGAARRFPFPLRRHYSE